MYLNAPKPPRMRPKCLALALLVSFIVLNCFYFFFFFAYFSFAAKMLSRYLSLILNITKLCNTFKQDRANSSVPSFSRSCSKTHVSFSSCEAFVANCARISLNSAKNPQILAVKDWLLNRCQMSHKAAWLINKFQNLIIFVLRILIYDFCFRGYFVGILRNWVAV